MLDPEELPADQWFFIVLVTVIVVFFLSRCVYLNYHFWLTPGPNPIASDVQEMHQVLSGLDQITSAMIV